MGVDECWWLNTNDELSSLVNITFNKTFYNACMLDNQRKTFTALNVTFSNFWLDM